MALDRESIVRRDFPLGRKGYDPAAVDAHLARIADEAEELRRSATRPSAAAAPMAQAASAQVQAIVQAAESTAAEIVRSAEEDAARIREEAVARSRAHVEKVRAATAALAGDVGELEAELGETAVEVPPVRPAPPLLVPEPPLAAVPDLEPEALPDEPPIAEEPPPVTEPAEAPAVAEAPRAEAPVDADLEGARLVALNMALSGSPREETDRYLAENFGLMDRDGLLDEVYATVES